MGKEGKDRKGQERKGRIPMKGEERKKERKGFGGVEVECRVWMR